MQDPKINASTINVDDAAIVALRKCGHYMV